MHLKPHVSTYLIPIGIIILSIAFAVFTIAKAGTEFFDLDESDWVYDLTIPLVVTEETTLFVFPATEDGETYTLINHDTYIDIRVAHTENTFTTYTVAILDSNNDPEGFTIETETELDSEELDMISVTFVPGTYQFDSGIELAAINFTELIGGEFVKALIVGSLVGFGGFLVAIAAFIIIAVKRSGSKKEYHKLQQAQMKKREQETPSIFND